MRQQSPSRSPRHRTRPQRLRSYESHLDEEASSEIGPADEWLVKGAESGVIQPGESSASTRLLPIKRAICWSSLDANASKFDLGYLDY